MAVDVRRIQPEEVDAWVRCAAIPFLEVATEDSFRHWRPHIEVDRAWAAVDGDRFVGNTCVFSRDITVPGPPGEPLPVVPMTSVSGVGVHPTHRRRGLMRRLMGAALADGLDRGEPVAGLLASDSGIYGQFGFGWATNMAQLTLKTSAVVAHRAPDLDLLICDAAEAAERIPPLFDRLRRGRAGQVSRNVAYWDNDWSDPKSRRPAGASAAFYVVGDDGYASYRVVDNWPNTEATALHLIELFGASAEVEAGLWQYLLSVDLVDHLVAQVRPADEPFQWRLADPRQLRLVGLRDFLWIRLLDLPAALISRSYRTEGRLVLEIDPATAWVDRDGRPGPDPAAGRWLLEAGPGGATCRPARRSEETDLRLGVAELGAAFLGGQDLSLRASAGTVDEVQPGALQRADALFGVRPLPFSATGF